MLSERSSKIWVSPARASLLRARWHGLGMAAGCCKEVPATLCLSVRSNLLVAVAAKSPIIFWGEGGSGAL